MKALPFNHVGIGVADIEAGIAFYRDVFGCTVVLGPFDVRAEDPFGDQAIDVLTPPAFGHMRMCHLATADGIGIELFQFIDPPHEPRRPTLEYWKSGVFHICLTTPDIEACIERMVAHGGRQRSKIWLNQRPDPFKKMVYCEDPWGTIIELYTHSYTDMYRSPAA